MLREVRLGIENSSSVVRWYADVSFDGAAYVTIGTFLTASGSLFPGSPGTSDQGTRIRYTVRFQRQSGSASATPPELRKVTLEGYFLPDVGNDVRMGIDIDQTATALGKTRAEVLTELQGYASTRQAFVDINGVSGHILIRGVNSQAPAKWGSVPGNQVAEVAGTLIEYVA